MATDTIYKVIARNLSITEGTVKVHVKHVLKKLGFRSRVEAAVWASEHGLRASV
jgi:two-component system nitrate/nitrite response regulator NarL